jgi:hypothetical protein
MENNVSYPQYRKYLNNKAYFKIISDKEWEEKQLMGSKVIINRFKVNIMPDRNYLYDMTFDYQNNWMKIDQTEYDSIV